MITVDDKDFGIAMIATDCEHYQGSTWNKEFKCCMKGNVTGSTIKISRKERIMFSGIVAS